MAVSKRENARERYTDRLIKIKHHDHADSLGRHDTHDASSCNFGYVAGFVGRLRH